MTKKIGFNIDDNVKRAYQIKVEAINFNANGSATSKLYQSIETGKVIFTASGERSFGFQEKQHEILYVNAHLIGESASIAKVMSVTSTGLTIFSQKSGTIYYEMRGSNP
jgi:hypothetical protein